MIALVNKITVSQIKCFNLMEHVKPVHFIPIRLTSIIALQMSVETMRYYSTVVNAKVALCTLRKLITKHVKDKNVMAAQY